MAFCGLVCGASCASKPPDDSLQFFSFFFFGGGGRTVQIIHMLYDERKNLVILAMIRGRIIRVRWKYIYKELN